MSKSLGPQEWRNNLSPFFVMSFVTSKAFDFSPGTQPFISPKKAVGGISASSFLSHNF